MTLSRRNFFKLTGLGAAAAATHGTFAQNAAPGNAGSLDFPVQSLGRVDALVENHPVSFTYPDQSSACQLLKLGHAVPGGIGPQQDIVAYSILCPHMGCPTTYESSSRRYKCGCHFSVFDPEMGGQQVIGQATQDLPRIQLDIDASGEIRAVGVQGLIYGRQRNMLTQEASA
ncbi:MAG: hypothetical protein RL572_1837 [Pseudomonadota bacterium]|jgi:arsenite oxidase small subunit